MTIFWNQYGTNDDVVHWWSAWFPFLISFLGSRVTFVTNFSKYLSYWDGERSISTLPFWKTFHNFPLPFFAVGKMSPEDDENGNWFRGMVLFSRPCSPHHLTYMSVSTKLLSKTITKKLCFSFLLLEGGYVILPY